jgi:Tol biopolymer transport system component
MNLLRIKRSGLTLLTGMAALMLMPVALMAQERIAYNAFTSGNSDIWSMKTDGSDPKQLTTNTASDGDPSFSPDGSKIAFVSVRDGNPEIYVMNADGTNQKRLTSNTVIDQDPSWSPDGSKIIFVSFRDTSADVFTMNPDGSSPVNLTKYPAGNETEPVFSRDLHHERRRHGTNAVD